MNLPVSAYDYFVSPPANTQTVRFSLTVQPPSGEALQCLLDIRLNIASHTKTIALYIPSTSAEIVAIVAQELMSNLSKFSGLSAGGGNLIIGVSPDIMPGTGVEISNQETLQLTLRLPGGSGEVDLTSLEAAKTYSLYCNCSALAHPLPALRKLMQGFGYDLVVYGSEFVAHVIQHERPKFFVSYASPNKHSHAMPIAMALQKKGVRVWFDEFEIKPGDSIRESIELGLRNCERCILVLTPDYLANRRMAKVEFESVFQRELKDDRNIFVPIWSGVTHDDVVEFCASLAGRSAITWPIEAVGNAAELERVAHAVTTVRDRTEKKDQSP